MGLASGIQFCFVAAGVATDCLHGGDGFEERDVGVHSLQYLLVAAGVATRAVQRADGSERGVN